MRVFLAAICLVFLMAQAPGALAQKPRVERVVCLICHTAKTMKPASFLKVVPQWRQSIHYQNGIACSDCHGGDPNNVALAMSPAKGFVGVPKYKGVPAFCGKCHSGILKNFSESVHYLALQETGKGPNCVTCHGSHDIQKPNINLINQSLCSRCHSYDRARIMKAALRQTEVKMKDLHQSLETLKAGLISTTEEEQVLFRTQEGYRSLFHTVDVEMVKAKTAAFDQKLDVLQAQAQKGFQELYFRRNFSFALVAIFFALALTIFFLTRESK